LQQQQHYINGNNYQQQQQPQQQQQSQNQQQQLQQLQQLQQQQLQQLQQQQQQQQPNSTSALTSGNSTPRVAVLLNSSSVTMDQQQTGVKALTGSSGIKYQPVTQQQTSSQTSTLHRKLQFYTGCFIV